MEADENYLAMLCWQKIAVKYVLDCVNMMPVSYRVSTPGFPEPRGGRGPRTFFNPETRGFFGLQTPGFRGRKISGSRVEKAVVSVLQTA